MTDTTGLVERQPVREYLAHLIGTGGSGHIAVTFDDKGRWFIPSGNTGSLHLSTALTKKMEEMGE